MKRHFLPDRFHLLALVSPTWFQADFSQGRRAEALGKFLNQFRGQHFESAGFHGSILNKPKQFLHFTIVHLSDALGGEQGVDRLCEFRTGSPSVLMELSRIQCATRAAHDARPSCSARFNRACLITSPASATAASFVASFSFRRETF